MSALTSIFAKLQDYQRRSIAHVAAAAALLLVTGCGPKPEAGTAAPTSSCLPSMNPNPAVEIRGLWLGLLTVVWYARVRKTALQVATEQ